MILKTASQNFKPNVIPSLAPKAISNLQTRHNVKFGDMTANHDVFTPSEDLNNDHLEMSQVDSDTVLLKGKIHNYGADLKLSKFEEYPKVVTVLGKFDNEEVKLVAYFKSTKEPEFTGSIGDNQIKIKLKQPLFSKNSLKGEINNKKIQVKFPSESSDDKYPQITALILNIAGFNTEIVDGKYTSLDTSNTRFRYFSGDYDKEKEAITFFNKIWKDPLFPPCV